MIPLVKTEERAFENLNSLSDFLSSQKRLESEAPLRNISLREDGLFSCGSTEGFLTEPAMKGLLCSTHIPETYGRCIPPDLLTYTVGRLVRDLQDTVRVHAQDNLITAIMPAKYLPVRHRLISESLDKQGVAGRAVLGPNYLRITTLHDEVKTVLPGDEYRPGWELINYENGLGPLEVRQYLLRLICLNGAVAFEEHASFARAPGGSMPIGQALQKLTALVHDKPALPEIEKGARWAVEQRIGDQFKQVGRFLSSRLEGETTRLGLPGTDEDTSWYDLFNRLTSFAQSRPGETRRQYEVIAGILLDWFMRQGRGHAPWRRSPCEHCTATA
jgi:hypothetical protein